MLDGLIIADPLWITLDGLIIWAHYNLIKSGQIIFERIEILRSGCWRSAIIFLKIIIYADIFMEIVSINYWKSIKIVRTVFEKIAVLCFVEGSEIESQ
jgi:hypothetical protein